MSGSSFDRIGDELGVTRARAQQIFVVAKQRVEQHGDVLPERMAVIMDNLGCLDGLEPDYEKFELLLVGAGLVEKQATSA
jgi:hypothetical protein